MAESAFEDFWLDFEVVGLVFYQSGDVPLRPVDLHVRVLFFKDAAVQVFHALEIRLAFELRKDLSIRCVPLEPIHAESLLLLCVQSKFGIVQPFHQRLPHFLFFSREGIINETSVIIVVLSGLHLWLVDLRTELERKKVLTEASEVLWDVF